MKLHSGFYFILKDKKVVVCEDSDEWEKFFKSEERIVSKSRIGKFEVSTVFLGVNFSLNKEEPIVFETMIFYKRNGKILQSTMDYQTRCSTYEQALQMHRDGCERVQRTLKEKKVQWKGKRNSSSMGSDLS